MTPGGDDIRVVISGAAEDLRRAARSAVRAIRDVREETVKANAESRLSELQSQRTARSFDDLTRKQEGAAQSLRNFGVSLKAIAWGTAIANVAPLAAGVADLGGAAVGATAALAPLSGAIAAVPAVMGAMATSTLTAKLAFGELDKALAGNKKAIESLDPAQRRLYGLIKTQVTPAIKELRAAAEKGLLPGFTEMVQSLLKDAPQFTAIIGDTAKALGGLAKQAGALFSSRGFRSDLQRFATDNARTVRQLGTGFLSLADAFRNVFMAAQPLIGAMGQIFDRLTAGIDLWAKNARGSGQLAQFFDLTRTRIQQVITIAENLGHTLFNVLSAANPLGGAMMQGLVQFSAHLKDITSSVSGRGALASFFTGIQAPLHALGQLVAALGSALADLAGKGQAPLTQLADTLRTAVLPVLHTALSVLTTDLLPSAIRLLGSIGQLLQAILPGLRPIVDLLASAMGLLKQIVDEITKITSVLPGVAKLIPTLAVGGAVLASWKALAGLVQVVWAGSAAGGVAGAAAGAGAAGGVAAGAASQSARNAAVLAKIVGPAAGGTAAGGFLANGGLRGALTRLVPRLAPVARVAGPAAAIGGMLAFPSSTGAGLPDFKAQIKAATDAQPAVAGMAKALEDLAGKWRLLAYEAGPDTAKKLREAADSLTNGIQPAKNLLSAIQTLAASGGKSMSLIKQDFQNAMREIKVAQDAGVISAQQAATETSAAYGALAKAILDHMRQAGRFTQQGMDQITAAVQREFQVLGISLTAKQAQRYGVGNDTLTGKPLNGSGIQGHAHGGYIGQPGERGTDQVPVMLGRGEAVLNRHQQAPVEHAMRAVYGIGLGDLFSSVTTPHYMASGGFAGLKPGIASAARRVLGHFPGLQITSTTGGSHAPGSYHYLGEAADLGGSPDVMNAAAAWIAQTMGGSLTEGIHNPNLSIKDGRAVAPSFWGASTWAQHANHIHLAVAGALKALASAIPRVRFPGGMGVLSALGQGALDKVRGAANTLLSGLGGSAGSPDTGGGVHGFYSKAALKGLWTGAGGPAGMANLMAAIALAESGGNPKAHNASGASGLWQILGQIVGGNVYDPHVNALNAVAKWRSQGLGAWATYTSGAYRQYLAQGGFVGMARGGHAKKRPGAHAAGVGDTIIGLGLPEASSPTKAHKKAAKKPPAPITKLNPTTGKIETHPPSVWRTITNRAALSKWVKSHAQTAVQGSGSGFVPGPSGPGAPKFTDTNTQTGDLTVNEQAFIDFFDGELAKADVDTPFLPFDPSVVGDLPYDPANPATFIHNPANLDDDLLWAGRKATLLGNIYHDRVARNAPIPVQGRIAQLWKTALGDLKSLQALHDAKQVPDTSQRDAMLLTLTGQQRDEALRNLDLARNQYGVFASFAPLAGARLVGSFANGTMRVPQTGLALLHRDEMVVPDPQGPYGNTITQPGTTNVSPSIEVNIHGDHAGFVQRVETLVDGKIHQAQVNQGRRARLIGMTGGRH